MSRSLKPQTGFSSYSLNDPSPGRKAAIVQVAVGRGWSFLVGVPPPSQLSGGGAGQQRRVTALSLRIRPNVLSVTSRVPLARGSPLRSGVTGPGRPGKPGGRPALHIHKVSLPFTLPSSQLRRARRAPLCRPHGPRPGEEETRCGKPTSSDPCPCPLDLRDSGHSLALLPWAGADSRPGHRWPSLREPHGSVERAAF